MRYSVVPVTRDHARDIAGWRYPGAFAVYNFGDDVADTVTWALEPGNRVHVLLAEDGSLAAYCSYGVDGRVPGWRYDDSALDVGLGLRPELTGRGLGQRVLEAACAFAEASLGATSLRVTVAAFNERALEVCRRAGFREIAEFARPDGRGFRVLVRAGPASETSVS